MPRYRGNWEDEYYDPISDAEDKRREEELERQSRDIMYEIELCREEEDKWWDDYLEDIQHREWEQQYDVMEHELEKELEYWDRYYG